VNGVGIWSGWPENFSVEGAGFICRLRRRVPPKRRIGSRKPLSLSTESSRNVAISTTAPVERDGMQKIKSFRSADCVVGGFRYGKGKKTVGSLLLGLYDTHGLLHHVGFTSSIPAADRPARTKKLEKLVAPHGFTGSAFGRPSRWNQGKKNVWHPLKQELVVEVCYDHVTGNRFQHGTKLLRWRPDKSPEQCKIDQLTQKKSDLLRLLK
jgi:ATP-dependent DNA ligase